MQNLLFKKEVKNNNINKTKNKKKLTFDEILDFYTKKETSRELIGLEYERLSLDNKTFKNAKFSDIESIITQFCRITGWQLVYDESTIIGAKSKSGSSISLEPGLQLEISLKPMEKIQDIDLELSKISGLIDKIASMYNVCFLGYGISPVSNCDDIKILNKKRYKIMYRTLPFAPCGELAPKMMKKTAGIQVNIDYQNETDAYYKLKFLNLIMPFMTALCANSPFESEKLTEYKSNRAHIWRYTGSERCNLFYKNIFSSAFFKTPFLKKPLFKSYIEEVLNTPMLFIVRDNKTIPFERKITFNQFLKDGYQDYQAEMDDYILHQSLCFPDIRLKQYIEIRNHDSSSPAIALALCAFYKGLLKTDIKKLLKTFSYLDFDKIDTYNKQILPDGLDIAVSKDKTGWSVISELFNIARKNLNSVERNYLEPLLSILKERKTQADIIIDYDINSAEALFELIS